MVFLSLERPSNAKARSTAEEAQKSGYNYPHVGATSSSPQLPQAIEKERWAIDHARVKIGQGKDTFQRAKKLVSSWGHFQLGWADVDPATPVKKGAPVCVRANVLGVWLMNPLEVVYTQEGRSQVTRKDSSSSGSSGSSGSNSTAVDRYSFAHGCLAGHLLSGEERFCVEWDRSDDSVWYEIHTFSKPGHPLALLGYPVVRLLQKRFAYDSTRLVVQQMEQQQKEKSGK